jgi:hypothetical protein
MGFNSGFKVKDTTARNINCRIIKKKVSASVNICEAWARAMRVETTGKNVEFTRIM